MSLPIDVTDGGVDSLGESSGYRGERRHRPRTVAGSVAVVVGAGLSLWIERTTAGCGCGGGC
ncbi:hypothetical protein [Haloterrigena salinisoli]|uniref:hypothetical protein n=1 Tax=Haloterrigena salinisoli TaxID=3132747 RepID=UPI0030CA7DCA